MDPALLNRQVEGVAAAHQRLLDALGSIDGLRLTDEMCHRASRLPGWSVGHVLAHLARNAESLVHLTEAAERGEVADQYPGGAAARNADIEADATMSAVELVGRVRTSIYALEAAWVGAREAWFGTGRMLTGAQLSISDLPLRRWREVEVHSGDLGLSELGLDGCDSWSMDYVRHDLPVMTMQWKSRGSMGMNDLPNAVVSRAPHERLAWMLGRLVVDGVEPARLMG